MTTISPEAFMAQPSEPDEDAPQIPQPLLDYITSPSSALDSIAFSLARLADRFEGTSPQAAASDEKLSVLEERVCVLREQRDDLQAEHLTLRALLEEIETIIKPSVSKLANEVRAAIKTWRDPEVPAEPLDEEHTGLPAHDAPVEVWREYAIADGMPRADAECLNRSQIRTALGIEQPS